MAPTTTAFRQRVYDATSKIPAGKVATYGQIAAEIGCGSSQAVGQALRHNPFAPKVPCHRVVNASLDLHGFRGSTADTDLADKRQMLEEEGVRFLDEGKIAPDSLHSFR